MYTLKLSAMMLAAAGMATAPLWAQQSSDARGIQLNFGVGVGFETQSNRGLDPANPGRTSSAVIDLSLGVLTETHTQRLSFDLSGSLRNLTGPGNETDGFDPFMQLRYDRTSASSRLTLSATYRETDLTSQGFLFDEETLEFTLVEGTATRRSTNLAAQLNWRDDAPLGFGVLAELGNEEFSGGVATTVGGTALNDTQRLTLGATARLDINWATRLNTTLTYSQFEEDGVAETRETWALSNSLNVARPRSDVTFNFTVTNTEEGNRYAASIGHSLEYPLGIVSGSIGATRTTTGETFLNGNLSLSRAMPRGNLILGLTRGVSSGALEDSEQVNTALNLGYIHELSPLASLSINANWAEAERTSTGLTTTNANLTATYTRSLIEDWNMNVGIRHRFRDDDVSGEASSNEVFLNLRRNFLTRF